MDTNVLLQEWQSCRPVEDEDENEDDTEEEEEAEAEEDKEDPQRLSSKSAGLIPFLNLPNPKAVGW